MVKQKHFILGFGFLVCLVPLYWAKTEADKMRDHMRQLQEDVNKEKKKIHTLEAEISYLTRYDRLEQAAREKLGLAPLNPSQIVAIDNIDNVAPIPTASPSPSTIAPVANSLTPNSGAGGAHE